MRNRSENGSSTQRYEDFNTRRYPEVKSKGEEILRSNSETTGGMKASAILMRNVLRSGKNQQQNANTGAVHHQDTTENPAEFEYDEVLR